MNKCPHCSAETRSGAYFCYNCGNLLHCPFCRADIRLDDNSCLNCGQQQLPSTPSPLPMQQALPPIDDAAQDHQSQRVVETVPLSEPNLPEATNVSTPQTTFDRVEGPARFLLLAESGETLQEYLLDKAEIVIGRAPTSDVWLSKDKLTSRRHGTVRYKNGQYCLYDDNSANGTYVNGQQIEDAPYVLRHGDHVGIGERELVFHVSHSPALNIEDVPTLFIPFDSLQSESVYQTHDASLTAFSSPDNYGIGAMNKEEKENGVGLPVVSPVSAPEASEYVPSGPVDGKSGNGASVSTASIVSESETVVPTLNLNDLRYSDISFPDHTVVGQAEGLRVAITRKALNAHAIPLALERSRDTSQSIQIDAYVVVSPSDFDVEGSNLRTITVPPHANSVPAFFKLTAKNEGKKEITVEFFQNSRYLGCAQIETMVAARELLSQLFSRPRSVQMALQISDVLVAPNHSR